MEIEAKFLVPNPHIARKLRALDQIGHFTLARAERVLTKDTFFDTRAETLRRVRYVLRVRRRSDKKFLITLKTPTMRRGAVHQRPELERAFAVERTPRALRVNKLPAPIRRLIAPLTQDELTPVLTLSQVREVRIVRQGRRVIAEWSLDHVRTRAGKRQLSFHILEIERKKSGTLDELQDIEQWLTREFHLKPDRIGKFARAHHFKLAS